MRIDFKNISVQLRNNNVYYKQKYFTTVKNASGSITDGRMMAIMGPTGSGKTSLLRSIACRIPYNAKTNGSILLDDEVIDPKKWMKMCTLVETTDTYYNNIYVDDVIKQSASFRMNETNAKNINERANHYKSRLHLHDSSGKKFGDLSIDERKRLMILLEIMSDAKIMCIDEPTGEMDACTAFDVINTLKELAVNEQKIIIVTLDQPNAMIYEKIDNLVLINEGCMIYSGEKDGIISMLDSNGITNSENMDEPSFLMQVFNKSYGYEEHGKYEKEIEHIIAQNTVAIDDSRGNSKTINSIIPYAVSMDDIGMLLKRRIMAGYSSIFNYFEYFYVKLLFLLLATCYLIFFVIDRIEHPEKNIPNYANIPKEMFEDSAFVGLIADFQKSYMNIFIPAMIALFSIYSLITAFSNESRTIKKELSTLSYSITSYYFATLFYEVIVHIVPFFIVYTSVQIGFFKICTIYTSILFMLSIIVLAPFIMLLGSFSFDRRSKIFYAILLAFFIVIPPLFVIEQMQQYDIPMKFGPVYFGYIYGLIPYHYYTHFFAHITFGGILKGLKDKFEKPETKDLIQLVAKKVDICENFGTNIKLSPILLALVAIIAPILCILLNILVLRYKLRPEIRTQLSLGDKKPINAALDEINAKMKLEKEVEARNQLQSADMQNDGRSTITENTKEEQE